MDIRALTNELVHLITGYDKAANGAAIRLCHQTLRNLRYHQFPGTNQFSVRASLAGLVEKFQVFNHDQSGDALHRLIEQLEMHHYRSAPDIIFLLLQLSDRPTEVSGTRAAETASTPVPPLNWTNVLGNVLPTVQEPRESLDDEENSSDTNPTFDSNTVSEVMDDKVKEDIMITANSLVIFPDISTIQPLVHVHVQNQVWRADPTRAFRVTELQCLRDVLQMLQGLPTRTFAIREQTISVVPGRIVQLEHASSQAITDLLNYFASFGSDLTIIRSFNESKSLNPVLGTFASCVKQVVDDMVERYVIATEIANYISLLDIQTRLATNRLVVRSLADIVSEVGGHPAEETYYILDNLYDRMSLAQTSGDNLQFEVLGKCFLDTLHTYLRPIVKWLEEGKLDTEARHSPFLMTATDHLGRFWHERHSISTTNGRWKVPKFLMSSIRDIFEVGNEVAFLKELTTQSNVTFTGCLDVRSTFTFGKLGLSMESASLLPFSESLRLAVQHLVQHKHQRVWKLLRDQMLWKEGLWITIEAFGLLYLSHNGSVFQDFATRLYAELDAGSHDWQETSVLDAIAQQTFGAVIEGNPSRIKVSRTRSVKFVSRNCSTELGIIGLTLQIPLSVQNVITPSQIAVYQRTFTLLLQLDRAKYLLCRPCLHIARASEARRTKRRPGDPFNCLYSVRHALIWFVNTFREYIFNSAIGPSWVELRLALLTAQSMDDLIAAHAAFLVKIERRCLLGSEMAAVHDVILSLLDQASAFISLANRQAVDESAPSSGQTYFRNTGNHINIQTDEGDFVKCDRNLPTAYSDDPHIKEVIDIHIQVSRLRAFLTEGLRNALRRSGGDSSWETLVEMLQC